MAVSCSRWVPIVAALRHRGAARARGHWGLVVEDSERNGEATTGSIQVTERSRARQELESSLRSLLPEKSQIGQSLTETKTGVAAVGFGSFLTGYLWGRVHGRRRRKAR